MKVGLDINQPGIGTQWGSRLKAAQDIVLNTFEKFGVKVLDIEGDLLVVRFTEGLEKSIKQANKNLIGYTLNIAEGSPGPGQVGLELKSIL